MPPANAKKQDKAQAKALEKQKQKIAEDKTFGLKNKNKSKAVQKFIKSVQNSVKGQHNVSEQKQTAVEKQKKEEKKKQLQEAALLSALFKGSEESKRAAAKQNPESIKETQKIDIYVDQRSKQSETMADWDEAKLEAVIKEKHGQSRANPTDIVCRFFIEAVEKGQYGWFWKCPNGGNNCKYRHCLPQGYVFKSKKVDLAPQNEESLENIIDRERAQLSSSGTKITLETFQAWKKKREFAKTSDIMSRGEAKKALSGKDLFTFDKSLFIDDAAAASEDDYKEEEGYWDSVINENQATLNKANEESDVHSIEKPQYSNSGKKDDIATESS